MAQQQDKNMPSIILERKEKQCLQRSHPQQEPEVREQQQHEDIKPVPEQSQESSYEEHEPGLITTRSITPTTSYAFSSKSSFCPEEFVLTDETCRKRESNISDSQKFLLGIGPRRRRRPKCNLGDVACSARADRKLTFQALDPLKISDFSEMNQQDEAEVKIVPVAPPPPVLPI